MVKLLIIADDFTGALDTGVQFAKRGIETQVCTNQELNMDEIPENMEVLVVNSETRPLSKEDAYHVVKSIAEDAVRVRIPVIFKKTDSALRGNVGSELQAVLDATGKKELYFLPAFPDVHRITKHGTHYVNGKLLEESAFGKDPFEPVTCSYIPKLLQQQTQYKVRCLETDYPIEIKYDDEKTIYLLDAQTKEDIKARTQELKEKGKISLLAGCAGLAAYLPQVLELEEKEAKTWKRTKGLYIACGSLNLITKSQIDYAKLCGFANKNLLPEQKLQPEYYDLEESREFVDGLYQSIQENKCMIVDTYDLEDKDATKRYAALYNIKQEEIRYLISECHGKIAKELVEKGMQATIFMTGGDTLMGFMKVLGCSKIQPICEIGQGSVLSNLDWNGKELQVISKSGGYGEKEILVEIAKKVVEE